MAMKEIEKLYGKDLGGLLSEGLDWMASYSCYSPSHTPERTYNPTQAVIAAALHALAKEDIGAFSIIHHVVNLSYFQYPYMKSWLKDDHNFSKNIVANCLTSLAWLVVEESLSPKSPFVTALTGLEEKYNLCGIFVQAVLLCAKRAWKGEEKTPEMKTPSLKTSFEVNETSPELGAVRKDDGATPLEPAVHLDKIEMIKILVLRGTCKQHTIISAKALLQCAVERESATTVDTLLRLSSDEINNDKSFSGLLNHAIKCKRHKILKVLLRNGLDMQFLNEEGNAPLHIAAASNQLKMVKALTFVGASVTQANGSGFLPLHLTADPDIIRHLLLNGTDVDAKTSAGNTALHLAVSNGNKKVVKTLLRFGARTRLMNARGLTPLLVALHSCNQEMADLLTRRRAVVNEKFCNGDESRKKKALAKGRLETVIEETEDDQTNNGEVNNSTETECSLSELEALQDSRSDNGVTLQELSVDLNKDGPIHKAATEGRLETVMELLDGGVDVDTKGCSGYTALQYAAKYGHLSIVQLLLQRGADMNMGNDWNWTPLHHAAHYSRCDIAEFLIQAGADTQLVDSVYGKTPLSWATYNLKIIQLFNFKGIYN